MLFLIDVFKDQCCFFFKKTVYNESFEIGIFNIINLEACLTVILFYFIFKSQIILQLIVLTSIYSWVERREEVP